MRATLNLLFFAICLLPIRGVSANDSPFSSQNLKGKLIFDAMRMGSKKIALGERGRIFISSQDSVWKAVKLPLEVSLTKIAVQSPNRMWIVGYDASLFLSEDQGETWRLIRSNPEWEAPLFDIIFLDSTFGIAVGAYGSYLETRDGGETWTKRDIDEEAPHFYSIQKVSKDNIYIAAEFGKILRTTDGGLNWTFEKTSYEGSWFGGLASSGEQLVFGLRSMVFEKLESQWVNVENEGSSSWTGSCASPTGFQALVGLAGQILWRRQPQEDWKFFRIPDRPALSTLICDAAPEQLFVFGENGMKVMGVEGDQLVLR